MKRLMGMLIAMATVLPVPGARAADDWPARPVRIVVPYTAGGPTDILTRALGQHLSVRLGQPIVVENRAGAAGGIGSAAVAKAAPDGYTLLFGTVGTHSINPHLYRAIGYDSLKDFAPITPIVEYCLVLIVGRDAPIRSIGDLVAMAKADPKAVTFGSSGVGASNHMLGEILSQRSGAPMTHIPYKGDSQALVDVVSGRVTFLMTSLPLALQNEKAGRVRVIATTGRARHPDTPGVPTIAESVPGVEFVGWFGFFAPAGTPDAIVKRLAGEIRQSVEAPDMKQHLVGLDVITSSPAAFAKRIADDYTAWEDIVKRAGVRLE